jgi:hypothetical protein
MVSFWCWRARHPLVVVQVIQSWSGRREAFHSTWMCNGCGAQLA